MKLSELSIGETYAVFNDGSRVRKDIVLTNIAKRDVWSAKLLSLDKYVWRDKRPDLVKEDVATLASPLDKHVGLLFEIQDDNQKTYYYVARISSVISSINKLEAIWKVEKEAEQAREKIEEEKREAERKRKKLATEHAERSSLTLPNTLKSLLGGKLYADVKIEVPYYSDLPIATVNLSLRDMERLIELIYDKKEEVA